MTDKTLSQVVGSGRSLIMPMYSTLSTLLNIKTGLATKEQSNDPVFYTTFSNDFTSIGFETATLLPTTDTTEQEIFNTGTGKEGVLTSVKTQTMTGVGTTTIRVYIDGVVNTFVGEMPISQSSILVLGDAVPWSGNSIAYNYGSAGDSGYTAPATQLMMMLSPLATLTRGIPSGMIFKDSCRVTIQGSSNLVVGSASDQACAAWLTKIPEGLR